MVEVSPVASYAVQAVWPDVEDYILGALERVDGEYNIKDVYDCCTEGKMHLLIAHDDWEVLGVLISEVIEYPRKRVLNCFAVGGKDLDRWIDLAILRFREGKARIHADYMKAFCRPGMARKLKKYGAKLRSHEMVMH